MKIAYTSDLHTDFSTQNADLVPHLVERIAQISPDLFVLAGDIATQRELFAETLAGFSELTCTKVFVPGNHDIWIDSRRQLERKGIDSSKKYYELLPTLCEDQGFVPIWKRPHVVEKVGFIGTLGWYDYSFRNKKFDDEITPQMYAWGRYGHSTWVDSRRAWWLRKPAEKLRQPSRRLLCKHDNEVCSEMADSLRRQCSELPATQVSRIVAVTHVLPFRQMVRHIDDLKWDFFAAFMGSEQFGEVLREDSRVSHVICGHLHRKRAYQINGIKAVSSPAGYDDEWQKKDYKAVAADCVGILDIE